MRHPFILWWACTERPFFTAKQRIEITSSLYKHALGTATETEPSGPFLHRDGGCCYIVKIETPMSEWDLA